MSAGGAHHRGDRTHAAPLHARHAVRLLVASVAAVSAAIALSTATPADASALRPTGDARISAATGTGAAGGFVTAGRVVRPNADGLPVATRTASAAHASAAATLPAAVSLAQYAITPGYQGQINSCTAWAIGYSMLGWYADYAGHATAYAPMYLYSQVSPKNTGASSEAIYSTLLKQGVPLQSQYSQGTTDYRTKPTAAERAAAASNRATTQRYLYNLGTTATPGAAGETAIKTAIAARHPVALAIRIFAPFESLHGAGATLRASSIRGANATVLGGHMVLVVGYTATGVLIENSWGTRWGDHGFATLDWAFVRSYTTEASWIYGFDRGITASVPAQPDAVRLQVDGRAGRASVQWSGTGGYADEANHPVQTYRITFTSADGSVYGPYPEPAAGIGVTQFGALTIGPSTTTWTMSIVAVNAKGASKARSIAFSPGVTRGYGPYAGAAIPFTMPKPGARA